MKYSSWDLCRGGRGTLVMGEVYSITDFNILSTSRENLHVTPLAVNGVTCKLRDGIAFNGCLVSIKIESGY